MASFELHFPCFGPANGLPDYRKAPDVGSFSYLYDDSSMGKAFIFHETKFKVSGTWDQLNVATCPYVAAAVNRLTASEDLSDLKQYLKLF
jgi:hypothetical protein